MRIRKRQVPLPLSSLSPVPISSDPHLGCSCPSPVVQLHHSNSSLNLLKQEDDITAADFHTPPPNQPLSRRLVGLKDEQKRKDSLVDERGEEEDDVRSNNFPKKWNNPFIAETESWSLQQSSFSQVGSFEEKTDGEAMRMENQNKNMMNKKCGSHAEGKESVNGNSTRGVNKRGRGGAVMEGSRCSRVNGRGWRCSQQTLVGYSLCEHHLGKGRPRGTIKTVRSRSTTSSSATSKKNIKMIKSQLSSIDHELEPSSLPSSNKVAATGDGDDEHNKDEEKKSLMIISKRNKMKVGGFKARSISSLLS